MGRRRRRGRIVEPRFVARILRADCTAGSEGRRTNRSDDPGGKGLEPLPRRTFPPENDDEWEEGGTAMDADLSDIHPYQAVCRSRYGNDRRRQRRQVVLPQYKNAQALSRQDWKRRERAGDYVRNRAS